MTYDSKKRFLINVVFAAVVAAIAFFCMKFLSGYLLPLVIGVLIAALIQRPINFLFKKTRIPRSIWAVFLVLISFSAVITLAVFLGYQFYLQIQNLINYLISNIPALTAFFAKQDLASLPIFENMPQSIIDSLSNAPATIVDSLTGTLTGWVTGFATNMASAAPAGIITFVVTIIATCYVAKDYTVIKAFIKKQIPQKYVQICGDVKRLFSNNLLKVGKGYLILMGITLVELSVGLLILRVNFAIPLAALIAVVDILPVLGVGTVLLPWAAMSCISGDFFQAIGLVVMYVIITIVRQVLEPKVISTQIGLFPLVTLLSMYVGLKLFGFFGMVGFPLVLIVITALQKDGKIRIWQPLTPEDIEAEKQVIYGSHTHKPKEKDKS
ncbi:MAG: sporulation integral membrane protein YtvI [Candidatus Howiella sp.]|jgi:sporulation integral membrane protein YtvI